MVDVPALTPGLMKKSPLHTERAYPIKRYDPIMRAGRQLSNPSGEVNYPTLRLVKPRPKSLTKPLQEQSARQQTPRRWGLGNPAEESSAAEQGRYIKKWP